MTTTQQRTVPRPFFPVQASILQRKCACGNHTIAGGECADCAQKKMGLQRKLTIGASNDPLEQEADRIADQVMALPGHATVSSAPVRVQRFTENSSGWETEVPPSVERVLASPGQPLPPSLQEEMEGRFGYDFSGVRIHTDASASESAKAVNALAYTVGTHIVFRQGSFMPGTTLGRKLVAHELTHTLQNRKHFRYNTNQVDATREKNYPDIKNPVSASFLLRQLDEEISPEEMYRRLTSQTAFREGLRGPEGRLLQNPADTRAILQLIDRNGHRIEVTFGQAERQMHAEEHALRRLRSLIGPGYLSDEHQRRSTERQFERLVSRQRRRFGEEAADLLRQRAAGLSERLVGGRLIVVVNQYVCEERCQRALRDFANEYALETVTAHIFVSDEWRPRRTFHTQTHELAGDRSLQRRDTVVYHQPERRRMFRMAAAGGITTLLGIVFAGASGRAATQAADAIRNAHRSRRERRRSHIRRGDIDLYNLEHHLRQVFENRSPLEIDHDFRNEFYIAILDWINRDYLEGGGEWWQFFDDQFTRGVRDNDTDLLGVHLVNWLDGAGINLGEIQAFGVNLDMTGVGGNRQYIQSALSYVNGFLSNESDYLSRAAASDQLATEQVSPRILELMSQYVVNPIDAMLITENFIEIGNYYRGYIHILKVVRESLNQAYRVNRERWQRLVSAIELAYERRGE